MKSIDEMIAVMEASKTKEIESCSINLTHLDYVDWGSTPNPSWNWALFDYRVKEQEPRRVWVNEYQGSLSTLVHSLKCQANSSAEAKRTNCVEFIELTPDVKSKLGLD